MDGGAFFSSRTSLSPGSKASPMAVDDLSQPVVVMAERYRHQKD
jgi:hypothetical protein